MFGGVREFYVVESLMMDQDEAGTQDLDCETVMVPLYGVHVFDQSKQ